MEKWKSLNKRTENVDLKKACVAMLITDKTDFRDFAGGAVVKNPPASAGDMVSSPGPGRSHMPRSN